MRILHLASSNRWTGAAAPAFAEVEALRAAGLDAHYAFVGGYKLAAKLQGCAFAHPAIEKAQNPAAFLRTSRTLAALGPFDVVHAHLTYDHLLALRIANGAATARTFHSQRVLRRDPFARALTRRTSILFGVNSTFTIPGRTLTFTPPPLDRHQFQADGPDARSLYGLSKETPVVTVIGKLAPERGFELAISAFAAIHLQRPEARLMIIGHGPHQSILEQHARSLGIGDAVLWAGYHEEDLAEHYRAANVLLFTARGSDEGHRAVLEAMACGLPPVAVPLAGIDALFGPFADRLVAKDLSPQSLAASALPLLIPEPGFRTQLAAHSERFGYGAAAQRLIAAYLPALSQD